jgi:peptidoglycan/xylan/chitin deacetylase (PgdA/CDA1 family)
MNNVIAGFHNSAHLLFFFLALPINKVLNIFLRRNRYVILLYHQIVDEKVEFDPARLRVNINDFERQLNWISKNCDVVSLADIVGKIKQKEKGNKTYVAVSFDDGYENNFKIAVPILKKYQIPATFFLATKYIDDVCLVPWWDMLELIIKQASSIVDDYNGRKYSLGIVKDKILFFRKVSKKIMKNYCEKDEIIKEVRNKTKVYNVPNENRFARWNTIQDLTSELFDFGAHTLSHDSLVVKNGDDIKNEFLSSRDIIQNNLNKEIKLLAYPYGGKEQTDCVDENMLQNIGFDAAVTIFLGSNNNDSNLYFLKRVPVYNFSIKKIPFRNYILFSDWMVFFDNLFRKIEEVF